ncbi:hypothetical protein LOCC1_G003844 [Lachnellula occidentalis]|uniref:YAG7-like dimerisation domain-containing protein n=1 Tax=Lachnellula occidentalis TaxID=215460 RepID=A0A8H8RZT8_9HELO|nr:hypothetical protein LOCC1_G003844 [Lachnellula occidentalis]
MAASITQNPPVKSESKSAKKKKAKSAPAEAAQSPSVPASNHPAESSNGDGAYESPYIKEMEKYALNMNPLMHQARWNIRGLTKKITNASKVDGIVAENPDKTLEQLVSERKINADQKAQLLKKPSLEASRTQLKEQIEQYKKFDQEYKTAAQTEKAQFEKTFTERSVKELEEAVAAAKAEAVASAKQEHEDGLLALSQFLKLAAVRRTTEEHQDAPENIALESLLVKVYTGDLTAVSFISKIIQGSTENVASQEGDILPVTYADIKNAYISLPPSPQTAIEAEEAPAVETKDYPVQSDPTIANAGLTELDSPAVTSLENGTQESHEIQGVPQNSGFGDGAANAAAESNWDNTNDLSQSQEWVEVPRDAAETDTGITATPAAPSNVQSWADEQPDSPSEVRLHPAIIFNTTNGIFNRQSPQSQPRTTASMKSNATAADAAATPEEIHPVAADGEVIEAAVEDTEVNSVVDEAAEVVLEEGAVETMPSAPVPKTM